VAANGSDVAALLCRLEDSPYFSQADLSYAKDAEVKTTGSMPKNQAQKVVPEMTANQKNNGNIQNNIQVSEFEISCYLSNYIQQQ
jgi:hypothetical protein